jgi:hypothetical protein
MGYGRRIRPCLYWQRGHEQDARAWAQDQRPITAVI